MDLKWPEMPLKVNFLTSKMADQSEMARNEIKSYFRISKMAAENGWNAIKSGHVSKMADGSHYVKKELSFISNRSEMARNAIESEIDINSLFIQYI